MSEIYNIYCDESCHLEHDRIPIMVLGAVWCPRSEVNRLVNEFKDIKRRYHCNGELKWNKVSQKNRLFYFEIIDWFFAESPLHFRALVVTDKSKLDHKQFNQGSHDAFYYKMYFSVLNKLLSPDNVHNIYIDIKDTRSRLSVRELRKILCFNRWDFTEQMINHIQVENSSQLELMQLADLLIGSVCYRNRGLEGTTKTEIVHRIERHLGHDLLHSTPLRHDKFNLFLFTPR